MKTEVSHELTVLGKAPMFMAAMQLALFIYLLHTTKNSLLAFLASTLLTIAFGFLVVFKWQKNYKEIIVVLLTLAVLSNVYVSVTGKLHKKAEPLEIPIATVEGTVGSMRQNSNSSYARFYPKYQDGESLVLIVRKLPPYISEGDVIKITGKISPLKTNAEGAFWGDVNGTMTWTEIELTGQKELSLSGLRGWLRSRLNRLQGTFGSLTRAFILGDRDPNLSEDFRRVGLTHYLAVSGFHVGIVALMTLLFLGKSKISLIFASLFIWLYVAISGFPYGGVRAALMVQTIFAGHLLGRHSSSVNSLSLACWVMLLLDPKLLFQLGWQMSVIATALILFLIEMKLDKKALFIAIPSVSWLIMAPLIGPIAGGLSISSLINNIFSTLFFSLFFPLCILFGSMSILISTLGAFLAPSMALILEVFFDVCDYICEHLYWSFTSTAVKLHFSMGLLALIGAKAMRLNWPRAIACSALFAFITFYFSTLGA